MWIGTACVEEIGSRLIIFLLTVRWLLFCGILFLGCLDYALFGRSFGGLKRVVWLFSKQSIVEDPPLFDVVHLERKKQLEF